MLALICLLFTGVVTAQTKPKQETFVPFLTTQRKSLVSSSSSGSTSSNTGGGGGVGGGGRGGGISGWFSRNILEPLGAAPRVPEHTITDYFFFHLAKLNDGSGLYIGMLQQWWVISELQEVSSTNGSGGNAYEAQAEAKKQGAAQAKLKKDCKWWRTRNARSHACKEGTNEVLLGSFSTNMSSETLNTCRTYRSRRGGRLCGIRQAF